MNPNEVQNLLGDAEEYLASPATRKLPERSTFSPPLIPLTLTSSLCFADGVCPPSATETAARSRAESALPEGSKANPIPISDLRLIDLVDEPSEAEPEVELVQPDPAPVSVQAPAVEPSSSDAVDDDNDPMEVDPPNQGYNAELYGESEPNPPSYHPGWSDDEEEESGGGGSIHEDDEAAAWHPARLPDPLPQSLPPTPFDWSSSSQHSSSRRRPFDDPSEAGDYNQPLWTYEPRSPGSHSDSQYENEDSMVF